MKDIIFIYAVSAILIFFVVNSYAAETNYSHSTGDYTISYELRDDFQSISLEGGISGGIGIDNSGLDHVISLLRKHKTVVLRLNSTGGMWDVIKKLHDALRNTCAGASDCHITTWVQAGDHCNSACIPLFMAGDARIAAPDSHFGFHKASYVVGPFTFDQPGTYEKMLKDNGVNAAWVDSHPELFASTKILEGLSYLTPDQLDGSGIVTGVDNNN